MDVEIGRVEYIKKRIPVYLFSFGGSGLCWSFYVGTATAKTRRGTLGYAAFF